MHLDAAAWGTGITAVVGVWFISYCIGRVISLMR
jgi:hypothetical protein